MKAGWPISLQVSANLRLLVRRRAVNRIDKVSDEVGEGRFMSRSGNSGFIRTRCGSESRGPIGKRNRRVSEDPPVRDLIYSMLSEPSLALRHADFDLRMDLAIAAIEFAAIVDVRGVAVERRAQGGGFTERS